MKQLLCSYYMPGLVLAIEGLKVKETLVPIRFSAYQNTPKLVASNSSHLFYLLSYGLVI